MPKVKQAVTDGDNIELVWYDTETGDVEEFIVPENWPERLTRAFLIDEGFEIEVG